MKILKQLQPAVTVPLALEGLASYELLCAEAGRTEDGLTGSVALQNGHIPGDPLKVCWLKPSDCCAARAALADQLTRATGRAVKDSDLEQPLRNLYQAVESHLHERRSAPAPSAEGQRPGTDLGNAERLIDQHGSLIRYCWPWSEWLAYDGTRWRRSQAAVVMARAKEVARSIYREAAAEQRRERRAELVEWARRSEARRSLDNMVVLAQSAVPVWPEQMDVDGWLLNCANGTVDLRTGALGPHRPEDLLTKSTGVAYDPEATCPRFQTFLEEIMNGDAEMVAFLHRALGYSISADVGEQCLFLPYGSGRNGKSLLLGTVQAALGDYAMQAVSDLLLAKRFDSHPTERADLFGKRFVATIEVEEGRRLAESLTKQLTGGDRIRARRMRQDFWEFAPTHKIWLAANHKPVVKGTDDAIWRRIHLVPFGVRFALPGQPPAPGAADGTVKPADLTLGEKLRAELPGILAWLVRGCLAWQAEGLKPPTAVTDATRKYREEMNVVASWIADCCVVDKRAWASAKDLYASYTQWCESNGEKIESQRELGQRLAERGFVAKQGRQAGKQVRGWQGLGVQKQPDGPPPSGSGPDQGGQDAGPQTPTGDGVTHDDASLGTMPQESALREQTGKSRHDASHASPSGGCDAGVTHVTDDDVTLPIAAHRAGFSPRPHKDASPSVTAAARTCSACGHAQWWQRPATAGGGRVCAHCHPPGSGAGS